MIFVYIRNSRVIAIGVRGILRVICDVPITRVVFCTYFTCFSVSQLTPRHMWGNTLFVFLKIMMDERCPDLNAHLPTMMMADESKFNPLIRSQMWPKTQNIIVKADIV